MPALFKSELPLRLFPEIYTVGVPVEYKATALELVTLKVFPIK
jgi:hypothetical protein